MKVLVWICISLVVLSSCTIQFEVPVSTPSDTQQPAPTSTVERVIYVVETHETRMVTVEVLNIRTCPGIQCPTVDPEQYLYKGEWVHAYSVENAPDGSVWISINQENTQWINRAYTR